MNLLDRLSGSILVKDIPFPADDPLVVRIQAYAKEKLPLQTYNHSTRVYYWGMPLASPIFCI